MNEFTSDSNGMELNSLQSLILNNSTPSLTQLSPDSLNMLKQHQIQLASSSYASLVEHQNQQLQNLQQFINLQKSNGNVNLNGNSSSSINNSNNISEAQYYANEANSEPSLNHLIMSNPNMNDIGPMNVGYKPTYSGNVSAFELRQQQQQQQQLQQQQQQQRERGIVEKLVGSYGFVKCLDREGRLFFHYSSFQTGSNGVEASLKVGDFVEFEEGTDKRNGKPIAINLMRFDKTSGSGKSVSSQQQEMSIDSSLNLMNLKELLLKNNSQSLGDGNLMSQQQQQHNYQTIMNSLKMLNMQNLATNNSSSSNNETTATNLNSIMNLFNKENIYNNNTNNSNSTNLNQTNINTNILNMAKTAAGVNGNDNLAVLAKMFNVNTTTTNNNTININNVNAEVKQKNNDEQMEGTVAIVATKRPINNSAHYVSCISSFFFQMLTDVNNIVSFRIWVCF